MATGPFGFWGFFWTCFAKAVRSVYGVTAAVGFGLALAAGAVQNEFPWTKPGWEYLNWVVPLIVGLALLIPAILRAAYELYRDVNARLEPLESRFNAKEQVGAKLYGMSVLIRRFETWSEGSVRESPVEQTRMLFDGLEQFLIDTVGLHYAARMHRLAARQRTETDLHNSYDNLCQARNELERIVSELPD
jgi:hypothetical protein